MNCPYWVSGDRMNIVCGNWIWYKYKKSRTADKFYLSHYLEFVYSLSLAHSLKTQQLISRQLLEEDLLSTHYFHHSLNLGLLDKLAMLV